MKLLLIGLCVIMATMGVGMAVSHEQHQLPSSQIIILLGPPGSGKGTQAVRLSKELKIPHISTGDLFRENLSTQTELGKRAKQYIEQGKLVPDELVLEMLFDRVLRKDCSNGYLLDGFPRTIPQAEAFEKHIKTQQVTVLNLNVNDNIIIQRLAGRLTCKECGHIHHLTLSPPSKKGFCDKCNGELYQRTDDKQEVVKERLRVYHEQTKPLISFYEKRGAVITVDGEKTPEEVFLKLFDALKHKSNLIQ